MQEGGEFHESRSVESKSVEDTVKETKNTFREKEKNSKVCAHVNMYAHDNRVEFYCKEPELKKKLEEYGGPAVRCFSHSEMSGYAEGKCEHFEDCGKSIYDLINED